MKIVTYNIQWGKGLDEKVDLDRIARTVADCDVIALQEVERGLLSRQAPVEEKRGQCPGHRGPEQALVAEPHWRRAPEQHIAQRAAAHRRDTPEHQDPQ